ncbi:hypothetical protein HY497_01665, partial [Candidatus Woesearchaeota archaeon]|nr:hypothetical protein [Candidatus Woesearchaeota archaeon]
MPVKLYGPRPFDGLVEKFFKVIEPHLDRKDETRVVVGPASFLDGVV